MIREKLALIPHKPGCYLMKNSSGLIIYVGKAKDLKNRLSTYFNGKHSGKTAMLVNDITDFDYVIVDNELESLILEINLIKKHKPKYNIMYMDDKSYPYILITNEKIPRLLYVKKNNIKKRGKFFGPYPNGGAAKRVVNLLNRLYPLRKCKIMPKKKCLYYHLGQCLGYCEENINSEVIEDMVTKITKFLNGSYDEVIELLKKRMSESSESLNYEMADLYKKDLEYIDTVLNKQKVESKDKTDRDIFNYYVDNGYISFCVFHVRSGKIISITKNIFPVIDTIEEEFIGYLSSFYDSRDKVGEILVPKETEGSVLEELLGVKLVTAYKGNKSKLLEMVCENAKINLKENFELIKRDENRTIYAMNELADILKISNIRRIEAFDNSNLFGSFSVSGMVVFIDGKPSKKEYRKYKISLDKNDDYNTMKEVIYRRYFKVINENLERPDIIIVDGGKNQINAARSVLASLNLSIPVFGLAKNEKHKTNELLGFDPIANINIKRDSNVFYLLNRIQDEVHRWTINYHKNIRSKGNFSSFLDEITGIGEKRKKMLLKKYGSLKKIKEATLEQLEDDLPNSVALELYEFLRNY